MKHTGLIRSVLSILPTSLLASIIACMVGRFVFGIPLEQLGVVASVPLVVVFALTRVLILVIPPAPEPIRQPDRVDVALAVFLMLGLGSSITMLISAGPYMLIGMPEIASGSLHVSGRLFEFSLAVLVVNIVRVVSAEISPLEVIRLTMARATRTFWEIRLFPRELSSQIYRHSLDPM